MQKKKLYLLIVMLIHFAHGATMENIENDASRLKFTLEEQDYLRNLYRELHEKECVTKKPDLNPEALKESGLTHYLNAAAETAEIEFRVERRDNKQSVSKKNARQKNACQGYECDYLPRDQKAREAHLRYHWKGFPKCEECLFGFYNKQGLSSHKTMMHSPLKK